MQRKDSWDSESYINRSANVSRRLPLGVSIHFRLPCNEHNMVAPEQCPSVVCVAKPRRKALDKRYSSMLGDRRARILQLMAPLLSDGGSLICLVFFIFYLPSAPSL